MKINQFDFKEISTLKIFDNFKIKFDFLIVDCVSLKKY